MFVTSITRTDTFFVTDVTWNPDHPVHVDSVNKSPCAVINVDESMAQDNYETRPRVPRDVVKFSYHAQAMANRLWV
jgi:predicted carbohydrate-binding protein with CBM5 and CBM33 domain